MVEAGDKVSTLMMSWHLLPEQTAAHTSDARPNDRLVARHPDVALARVAGEYDSLRNSANDHTLIAPGGRGAAAGARRWVRPRQRERPPGILCRLPMIVGAQPSL